MTAKKRITDARNDADGNISHVQFDGSKRFTPVDRAIEMAKRDRIENAHVSHTKDGKEYLRTNPNKKKGDNLDEMAGD